MVFAIDFHEPLIEAPPTSRKRAYSIRPLLADLGSEDRAEPIPPEPDRLGAHLDPAFVKKVLDIAQRQWEAHLHHHCKANDLGRSLGIAKGVLHPKTLQGASRQLKPVSSDSAQAPTRAGRDGKRLSSTVYGYTFLLATPRRPSPLALLRFAVPLPSTAIHGPPRIPRSRVRSRAARCPGSAPRFPPGHGRG